MARTTPAFHPLEVAEIRHDTDDSAVITFAVPDELADAYRFDHGQHVALRADLDGAEVRRSYSVCAPVAGPLRVGVRRVPDGTMSRWLNDEVRAGDVIDVMTPTGSFSCAPEPDEARRHVAIAAGSGITPVLSIVATLLAAEPSSSVSLLYVNRGQASTMFIEDLEALKNRYLDRLRITHLFTREPGPSELLSGRLDADRFDALAGAGVVSGDADTYFVCGPQELTETVVHGLLGLGVDEHCIHTELFGTPGPPRSRQPTVPSGTAGATECTIVLNGRTSAHVVDAGEVVLDAVRRSRPDVPYSCTAGACSTCRARVVDGRVEMDVCYGLEADEIDAGFVLTCQARPVSDTLVLDYDA